MRRTGTRCCEVGKHARVAIDGPAAAAAVPRWIGGALAATAGGVLQAARQQRDAAQWRILFMYDEATLLSSTRYFISKQDHIMKLYNVKFTLCAHIMMTYGEGEGETPHIPDDIMSSNLLKIDRNTVSMIQDWLTN